MHDVIIPKMGQSTVEVELVAWRVKLGEQVEAGQILVDVESEKTTLEIEAPVSGTIAEILVEAGIFTEVGTTVCRIQTA